MSLWVVVKDGKVTQCKDTAPSETDAQWNLCVEIKPLLTDGQLYGDHYFNVDKSPIELVYPVISYSADELAEIAQQKLNNMKLSRADAKLKLLALGLYTDFDTEIKAMPDCAVKILWNNVEYFHRSNEDLISFLTAKSFSAEQIDALFV